MKKAALALVLLSISLSGCLDEGEPTSADDSASEPRPSTTDDVVEPSHLVNQSGHVTLGVNPVGPYCELSSDFSRQSWLPREAGANVDISHTELEFMLTLENAFSDIDYTGYRIGAYYDHELVFWSDAYKESTTFTHELDGSMPDLDKDQLWTFSLKTTDPLTENDPDGCKAGQFLQSKIDIQIYAR